MKLDLPDADSPMSVLKLFKSSDISLKLLKFLFRFLKFSCLPLYPF